MAFDGSRFGTGLMAFGAGLQGGDPMVPINRYRDEIERNERKGNISALMSNMGIGGNQRALLDMMPQETQMASLYELQEQNRANEATDAANAGFMQSLFPQSGIPETSQPSGKADFIEQMMPYAIEAGNRTGVDPRIIIAQSAQETGWGDHAPNNNYFGIKSHGQPNGAELSTMEYSGGQPVNVSDSFRQYGGMGESVSGYADFLLNNPRYNEMMQAQGMDAQLAALGRSGYATDPNYATSVGQIARSISMPQQGGQEVAGDPTLLSWMNMAANPNLGAGQKQYLDMLIADRMGGEGTTLMQNYDMYAQQERAAGRQPASFMDYQQQLKAGTNVTVNNGQTEIGPIPAGWETYTDAATDQRAMRPIPGGPIATSLAQGVQMTSADFADYEANTNMVLDVIKGVLESPGLEGGTGFIQGRLGGYNQDTANFIARHDQLQGNVFLEAYEKIKGGGPITDYEGDKASNALARLQRTQDAAEYRAALMEFYEIINDGLERARGGQSGSQTLTDEQLFEKYR